MFALLHSVLTDRELESFPASEDAVTAEKIEKVESFDSEVIESGLLVTILCCTGAKEGGDITCHFKERERFEEFIELLNSMGLNCFVDFNPEKTEAENLRDYFGDEVSDEMDSQLGDSEVRAHIFMTKKEDYGLDFFRKLFLYRKFSTRYHVLYGEFLGFPEENISCFRFHQRNRYIRKMLSLLGKGQPDMISDWELAERHEEDLTEEQFEDLRAFVYCMYPDVEGSLQKALERAKEKRRMLEAYDVDVQNYIDLFTDWNT